MAHEIQVDIRLTKDKSILAYGTVTVDQCIRFTVQMRKYVDKETGEEKTFLSYPRRHVKGEWSNAVYPDKELQEEVTKAVIEAVKREIRRDIHLPELEDIQVTVLESQKRTGSAVALCGLATIKICGLTINGITIKESEKGLFCNMPQYKSGEEFRDSVYGITKEVQQKIMEEILQVYREQINVPESGTGTKGGNEMKQNTNDKPRLFVDMDGTLAVFKSVDCLETLYEKGYFETLQPIPNTIQAVKKILDTAPDIDVYILSSVLSDSPYAEAEKNRWLDKYLPEIPPEKRLFPPCGTDKKEYIPDGIKETDHLLDDYTKNLSLWQPPGIGIKLLNGINHTHETWQEDTIWYKKDAEIIVNNILDIVRNQEKVKDQKVNFMQPEKKIQEKVPETTPRI